MSISRSSKAEYDFQQIQLEHVQNLFFVEFRAKNVFSLFTLVI